MREIGLSESTRKKMGSVASIKADVNLSQSSSWLRRPEEELQLSLTFGAKNNGQDSGSIIFTSVVSVRLWVVVD